MRLVYGDQGQLQPGQEPIRLHLDPLGRDIEQLDLALYAKLLHLLLLLLGHHAVQRRRRDAVGEQALYLVLHQGDQGRHDQGRTRQIDRRQLEADRLAATRGHQHQRVLFL